MSRIRGEDLGEIAAECQGARELDEFSEGVLKSPTGEGLVLQKRRWAWPGA